MSPSDHAALILLWACLEPVFPTGSGSAAAKGSPQAPPMREFDLNATGNRANDELAQKLFQGGRANGFVEHRRGQALSGRSALPAGGPPNRPEIDPAAIGSTDQSGRHRGKDSPSAGGIAVRGRRVSAPDKLLETATADSFARGLGPGAGEKTVRTSILCPGESSRPGHPKGRKRRSGWDSRTDVKGWARELAFDMRGSGCDQRWL